MSRGGYKPPVIDGPPGTHRMVTRSADVMYGVTTSVEPIEIRLTEPIGEESVPAKALNQAFGQRALDDHLKHVAMVKDAYDQAKDDGEREQVRQIALQETERLMAKKGPRNLDQIKGEVIEYLEAVGIQTDFDSVAEYADEKEPMTNQAIMTDKELAKSHLGPMYDEDLENASPEDRITLLGSAEGNEWVTNSTGDAIGFKVPTGRKFNVAESD